MQTTATTREEVIRRVRKLAPELRVHGVHRLSLFGSFAKNAQRQDSDVDFLVQFVPARKSYDNFLAVCEMLESALERRVELVTTESLSPYIGDHILDEAVDVVPA